MVVNIDGNWSNGTLRTGVSNLGGVTTNGFRTLGDGIFYCEIFSENTVSYKSIGVATTQNQGWISSGQFTNALYPIGYTSIIIGSTYGILLDLTGVVGKFCWNKDGGEFSSWVNLIDSKGNIIKDFKIAIVGSSSGGGSQYFTINYNIDTFVTRQDDILSMAQGDVYTFDGSKKIRSARILLKSNDKIYSPIMTQRATTENLSKYVKSITASGGSTPEKTIDGNTSGGSGYGWYSVGLPSAWIRYEFNSAIAIDRISIFSYYISGYEAIKDFVIEASHTGQFNGEQSVLYKGTHPNDTTASFLQYKFLNNTKYKFYRIDVKNIHYGNGNDNLSISEVQFWKDSDAFNLLRVNSPTHYIFSKYGGYNNSPVGGLLVSKQYLLQESEKDSSIGLLVRKVESKPTGISFN
ncbi:discoidin domain-containing protein [Lysinibacillus fusiformis]|uniref:discoidin domain-containing protein n=1 Tax=Lysinibacillus fusiformis TaxID=28031 RepID=UPI0021BF0223|nr:discoidin domain-containing protein [Lysinibacillus fusiformis]UXJ70199.1 discoidin domain-containing protein [Lysinibacillus fusiformis]